MELGRPVSTSGPPRQCIRFCKVVRRKKILKMKNKKKKIKNGNHDRKTKKSSRNRKETLLVRPSIVTGPKKCQSSLASTVPATEVLLGILKNPRWCQSEQSQRVVWRVLNSTVGRKFC